jgi:hypothetical protein
LTPIEELQDVIRKLHGAEAKHRESVHVKEVFNGETVWEGMVEVFDLIGHPKASRVYAWTNETGDPANPKHHVTVLHLGPVKSALDAVRAAIVQEFRAIQEGGEDVDPA